MEHLFFVLSVISTVWKRLEMKQHFFFTVWTLQRIIDYSKQKQCTPGIKIKKVPMFLFTDSFMQLSFDFVVFGTKSIVAYHFEIFSRICWMSNLIKLIAGRVFMIKNQTEKQNLLRLMDQDEINISKYEIKELCDKKLFFF